MLNVDTRISREPEPKERRFLNRCRDSAVGDVRRGAPPNTLPPRLRRCCGLPEGNDTPTERENRVHYMRVIGDARVHLLQARKRDHPVGENRNLMPHYRKIPCSITP